MTEEEAAKLAEECNGENINGELFCMTTTQLAMFADSVQLDEREACAKVCEAIGDAPWADVEGPTPHDCADEIRKRSNVRVSGGG